MQKLLSQATHKRGDGTYKVDSKVQYLTHDGWVDCKSCFDLEGWLEELEPMNPEGNNMKAGDSIRLDVGWHGMYSELEDFTVEEFRYCLGIFRSDDHKKAGNFTPLCELYESGPESETKYISNYGEYVTNKVPAFMNIPKAKGE